MVEQVITQTFATAPTPWRSPSSFHEYAAFVLSRESARVFGIAVALAVTGCGGIVQEYDRTDGDGGALEQADARPVPTVVSRPAEQVPGTPVAVKPRGTR